MKRMIAELARGFADDDTAALEHHLAPAVNEAVLERLLRQRRGRARDGLPPL